ncbi:MAG TPA: hypothetical protein VMV49_07525 [Candidatus Deferrimicrobium sp.]|nr:hypothetical protein [Candidatus Deferrimicrobium sp.]
MTKDEIKNGIIDLDIKKKKCSICNTAILPGQFYTRDIVTNDIICSNCDDGQVPIKGDNLISID